jgi:thioredoxin 1
MADPNDEFKTTSGKVYKNGTVNRVEPDGIILVTNSGVSKIYFTELPQDVQQRFHYDPNAAKAYASAQAANQAAFQKQQEDARRKLTAERNKYWASLATGAKQSGKAAAGAVSSVNTGSGIKVIAHGERVDINRHLALGRVTIIDFYADWCGPCRQVSPYLEQLANTDPEVALRKIDIVNWTSAVASQYSVHSIPQVNVYNRRGTLIGTVVGSDVQQIQRYVAQAKTSG